MFVCFFRYWAPPRSTPAYTHFPYTAPFLSDYGAVIAEMYAHGGATTLALRKRLAATAFAHTASYDGMSASWFAFADQGKLFPDTLPLTAKLASELRYGENPPQKAALYLPAGPAARSDERRVGKEWVSTCRYRWSPKH